MDTIRRARQVVASVLQIEEDRILAESRLTEDLGADSLYRVEIAMGIEDEFGIQMADEDDLGLVTFADLVACVERRIAVVAR